MFDIKEELKKLPDAPGVYLHKDAFGQIIYVGKAVNLKRRVRQYFQSPANQPPKVRRMVEEAYSRAKEIISSHREQMDELAGQLYEREVLFSEDLERIYGPREETKDERGAESTL